MAFATSNTKQASAGNLKWFVGEWTGAAADANGSITLKGGIVYLAHFENQDATSQEDKPTPTTVSVSNGTITINVANRVNVTNGRFVIIYS